MSAKRPMKSIVPGWQIGLVLVLAGIGVYFLVPDSSQLLDDLVRDGKTREARRVLENTSAAERMLHAEHFRLIELRLAWQELPPADPAAAARYWRQALDAWRGARFAEPFFAQLWPAIARLPDPAAGWSEAAPLAGEAPPVQRQRLTEEFTRAALAANQPAAAAEAFAAGHPAAGRATADTLELARLWRLADRPAEALAALGDDGAPAVVELRIELLRQLGRGPEAFALLRAQAEARPTDAALTERLATVGLQAGLAGEAASLVRRYLDRNPADVQAWRRLRGLLLTAGQPADAAEPARQAVARGGGQPDDVRELARILEFSGQPGPAFDAWLRLATAGDVPAADRLVALNPGLYRDLDLAHGLEGVVPAPGRNDLTLVLARLETVLGRYDRARQYFERYLEAEPAAAGVMVEFARLHIELYRFPDAEKWLRRALALRPGDTAIQRELAESLVAQNRHGDALALYARLAAESNGEEVIGPYVRLAESLGRYDEFVRGVQRRIDTAANPTARDYLLLAFGYELMDEAAPRQAALEAGLRRWPQDEALRLQLAITLAAEKNYQAAQKVLAVHPRLHEEPGAATLYLDLMRLNNDRAAEREFLKIPFTEALLADESVLERVARAWEALGDFIQAERIARTLYLRHPRDFVRAADLARALLLGGKPGEARTLLAPWLEKPSPDALRLAAEVAEAAGDHRAAEKYQTAYLGTAHAASATDWGALGDIRLARGDRTGAKRAYAEALRRLQAQIAAGKVTR